VNKIFQTAVYTAHLSMQDSILDGIKRDRGRWIGDDEVINRVVLDVYGNVPLVKEGLEDALGPEPVTEDVNGLPGYSAWWVVAEWEYFERTGDLEQLRSVKARLLELLRLMEKELDERKVWAGKGKPFVDWSKGFSGESPEARRAVHFEYMMAFDKAEQLLETLKDDADSGRYVELYDEMAVAASKYLREADGSFGDRWQTNALFLPLGALPPPLQFPGQGVVWPILNRVNTGRRPYDVITPYFGSQMLKAMSDVWEGDKGALSWMKAYWGGMLDDGATSFWEAWDPAWAGDDPHAKLEADDKVGYNASLSHGWSSGPAAWLLEEILGVKPGYKSIYICPELAGLNWVKGAVTTPQGPIRVEASATRILVVVPDGVRSSIVLPKGTWTRNGVQVRNGDGGFLVMNVVNGIAVDAERGGRFEFLKQ